MANERADDVICTEGSSNIGSSESVAEKNRRHPDDQEGIPFKTVSQKRQNVRSTDDVVKASTSKRENTSI